MKIRYIRDWQNGRTVNGATGSNCDWREVQAIDYNGNNIALNKIPTPSHTMNSVNTNATDGNFSTSYWTNNSPNVIKNITLDLGGIYDIDKIVIARASSPAICKETKTEVSVDGSKWVTIFDSATSGTYQETESGKEFELEDDRLVIPSEDNSLNEIITFFEKFLGECNINKDNLKNALISKDVEVLPNDKMPNLINKVFGIELGKKWATGTVNNSNFNQSLNLSLLSSGTISVNKATLTGLGFKPSIVIMVNANLTKNQDDGHKHFSISYSYGNGGTIFGVSSTGSSFQGRLYRSSYSELSFDSFELIKYSMTMNGECNWYAFE